MNPDTLQQDRTKNGEFDDHGLSPPDDEQSLQRLADQVGMTFVNLEHVAVDAALLASFPSSELLRRKVLPIERRGSAVLVAISDPFDLETLDDLAMVTKVRLIPALARGAEIDRLIKSHVGVAGVTIDDMVAEHDDSDVEITDAVTTDVTDLDELSEQRSVVKLVNELLSDGVEQGASDIHLEAEENKLEVRYRVDGLLRVETVSSELIRFRAAIIARIKILAKLNIAEKRLPQDGRFKLRISGREIDVRVSIIPMLYGESIVMRLLDRGRSVFSLDSLNLPPDLDDVFRRLITKPHGIILLTGPTGSGKTTTLYSVLAEIKDPTIKIITIEDPVEYSLPGIRQIQVHEKIGRTFPAALRSILRHDPDVVLIGEVRDAETAHSAMQASLTGHLVLSTLHTNDSCSALTRLVDMGVEPYLVASTVQGVLAQRLVRKLCSNCKVPYDTAEQGLPLDFPNPHPTTLWKPAGCRECRATGYKGRIPIFELLVCDNEIRRLCNLRSDTSEVRSHALKNGLMTLRQCGWRSVRDGLTSVDEILRVTGADTELPTGQDATNARV